MKIKFLGTGAAEGVPAEFCNCEYCQNIRKIGESEFRTRSQVVIDGILSVDFPPDAYMHFLKYGTGTADIEYLLVTHSHMDHFYAHDFILRGYKYASLQTGNLAVYGNAEVGKVFCECTAREMKPEVAQYINFTQIKPYTVFNAGEYRVIAIPAVHSKEEDCLLYYIERDGKGYLHLYDTGNVTDEAIEFLKVNGAKAGVVAFDCTFAERNGGLISRHMGICDNMQIKQKLIEAGVAGNDTKYLITHFSHNANPLRENLKALEEQYGVIAAYDGLEIEI